MREVEDQLARVMGAVRMLPTTAVPISEAAGRTLARPALAAHDIPLFDNSSMDGFAVRAADLAGASDTVPVRLRVVGDVPAGSAAGPRFDAGETVRIMTGSPVPADADAIVPFEDTRGGLADSLGEIDVRRAPRAGAFIRRRGDDLRAGDEVVAGGERVGAYALAALVAAGVREVEVSRAPRVAIVSTGSELVDAGETPGPGRIPDSNGPLLATLMASADAEVLQVSRVGDDPDEVLRVTREAVTAGADVVVFSGGVSAGAYEPVRAAFEGGGAVEFAPVAMQPGKPQAFGTIDDVLIFGLPGNPVSVAVSFEVFVRPALLAMQGRRILQRPLLTLAAATGWRTPPGRRQYLPAIVDLAAGTVRPATAGGSGSHLAGGLARAEALAIVPADVAEVTPGDRVDVMLVR